LPAWLGVGAGTVIAHLPWAFYRPMSWIIARLMRLLMRRRGHIVRTNIELCFPDLTPSEQKSLWRSNFDSTAYSLFEFLRGWWGPLSKRERNTPIEGYGNLLAAQKNGKGVLLISPHLTNLEVSNQILGNRIGMAAMYRPMKSPVLEWSIKRGRTRHGEAMFARDELRPALRYLKSGGIIWLAPDQETRRGDSVFVPFFGRPAWSLTSVHQMAKLTGAAVLPFFHARKPEGGYQLEIQPALSDFPSDDPQADTARVMAIFEAMIRRCPEQYLWMHARFKRQPDGSKLY
jgi:KDO2-lipid IV(A) lauroyltransferase